MKKLLGIVVLGLLLSGNANAGINEPGVTSIAGCDSGLKLQNKKFIKITVLPVYAYNRIYKIKCCILAYFHTSTARHKTVIQYYKITRSLVIRISAARRSFVIHKTAKYTAFCFCLFLYYSLRRKSIHHDFSIWRDGLRLILLVLSKV